MGAFPANGSQSRSFVLAETGARTQLANVVAAALVVLTLLFLAPVFDYLPTATLAAIVIVAGFGLLDLAEFRSLWRYRRSEFWMAVITIIGVLGLGMLVGILVRRSGCRCSSSCSGRQARTRPCSVGLPDTDTYRDVADHPDTIVSRRADLPFFARRSSCTEHALASTTRSSHSSTTTTSTR